MIATILAATLAQTATIDVCVVSFFPCRGDQIDQSGSYVDLRAKTRALTIDAAKSPRRGFAIPWLQHPKSALPTLPGRRRGGAGGSDPFASDSLADYRAESCA